MEKKGVSSVKKVKRYLKLDPPIGQSIFLWGARNSGKSTYLRYHFPDSVYYDLLQTDVYLRSKKIYRIGPP